MYDKVRSSLNTGDIVLFSGKGPISSLIKLTSFSKWSHVGIVIKSDEWDTLLLWESTTLSKTKDFIDGKLKSGVQIVALSDRIAQFDGEVCARRLITGNIDDYMKQQLAKLRKQLKNKPYEKDKIELVKSVLDLGILFKENVEDLSSVFCSELVAEALKVMGILKDNHPSNEYVPKDFDVGQLMDKNLKNFQYSDLIKLK